MLTLVQGKMKMRGEMLRQMLELESQLQDTREFKMSVYALIFS